MADARRILRRFAGAAGRHHQHAPREPVRAGGAPPCPPRSALERHCTKQSTALRRGRPPAPCAARCAHLRPFTMGARRRLRMAADGAAASHTSPLARGPAPYGRLRLPHPAPPRVPPPRPCLRGLQEGSTEVVACRARRTHDVSGLLRPQARALPCRAAARQAAARGRACGPAPAPHSSPHACGAVPAVRLNLRHSAYMREAVSVTRPTSSG